MRKSILLLTVSIGVTASMFAVSQPTKSTTYKWIDESGKIVYSDKKPLEVQKKGVSEMTKQGLVTKEAESDEQRKVRLEAEARARVEGERLKQARRKDRALLDAYTSTKQIEQRRDRSVELIQTSINAFTVRKNNIQKRLSGMQTDRQNFVKRKKPVPQELQSNINVIQGELNGVNAKIQEQQKSIQQIRQQASSDIKRYIELTQTLASP